MNKQKNKFIAEKKSAEFPNKKFSDFYGTLEGKTLKHIITCTEQGNLFETYIFLWALIEQVLLTKLISFVSDKVNVIIPKSFNGFNQATKNIFYLGLSHDKELFDYLENGRKKRNSIIHKLIQKHSEGTKDSAMKEAVKNSVQVMDKIFSRLTGKTPVPVLTLYSSGWNDCIKQFEKNLRNKLGIKI